MDRAWEIEWRTLEKLSRFTKIMLLVLDGIDNGRRDGEILGPIRLGPKAVANVERLYANGFVDTVTEPEWELAVTNCYLRVKWSDEMSFMNEKTK